MAVTTVNKSMMPDLYDRNIKLKWMQGFGDPVMEYHQIYDTIISETEDERSTHISGLGLWQHKSTTNVPYDVLYQGYDVTITPAEYHLAIALDEKTVEDDKSGILAGKIGASLAQTGKETQEVLAAFPLNNASLPTCFLPWSTMGDGLALLSTVHPILSGGVFANTPATPCDLSVRALKDSRTRMNKIVNCRGLQQGMEGKTLVVPTDTQWMLAEILNTEKGLYSGDQTDNVVRKGLAGVVWSKLTDNDCWFLLAQKATSLNAKGHMLVEVLRVAPKFERTNEFETGDRKYKGRIRVGFGAWDWRGVDGSMGI